MNIQIKLTIAFLITILILSGCNKYDNAVNQNPIKPETILFFPGNSQIDEESIIATLTIYNSFQYSEDINNMIKFSGIDAAFYNSTNSVWAGDVTLNNEVVESYSAYDSLLSINLFAYGQQPYNSVFDGRQYNWAISGSSEFQSFNISIDAPHYLMSISNITPNQNISKNTNLVINWNNNNSPTDGIKVIITKGSNVYSIEGNDNGICTINSSNLTQFTNGPATIIIFSGNYSIYPVNNNMNALALIYSSYEIPINITN